MSDIRIYTDQAKWLHEFLVDMPSMMGGFPGEDLSWIKGDFSLVLDSAGPPLYTFHYDYEAEGWYAAPVAQEAADV